MCIRDRVCATHQLHINLTGSFIQNEIQIQLTVGNTTGYPTTIAAGHISTVADFIHQQLAKNLFPRDTVRNRGRIVRSSKLVVSKLKEWITALKL